MPELPQGVISVDVHVTSWEQAEAVARAAGVTDWPERPAEAMYVGFELEGPEGVTVAVEGHYT